MLQINQLSVVYPNGWKAVDSITTRFEVGKIYGILGPNGAGKSSFLKGILGLVPFSGIVLFNESPIKERVKEIAYVEQKGNIDRDFPITVFQCVLSGTYPNLGLFKRPQSKEKAITKKALHDVGLWEYKNRQIGELSGGQFQRVLIARALAQQAKLILMDEPFVGVDINNEVLLIRQLRQMKEEGKTTIIVHHDLSKVKDYFDEVLLIHQELIMAGPTSTVFTRENILKTYKVMEEEFIH